MRNFLKIKFVFFLLFISNLTFTQEKNIKIFQKIADVEKSAKLTDTNLHLLTFPLGKEVLYLLVDKNKAWKVEKVNYEEWQELSGNTLVVVQQLEGDSSRALKKTPEPILLNNFTFNEFKQLTGKEVGYFSISWSMNTIYSADSSVQTSKRIETSNCCDKGTCSVLISVDKKNGMIYLISGVK